MRLQLCFAQERAEVTGGHGIDDATLDGFFDNFPLSPACDRSSGIFNGFTCDSEDHCELFAGELWCGSTAWQIAKQCDDGFAKFGWRLGSFNDREPFELIFPSLSPEANLIWIESNVLADLRVQLSFKRQENNPSPCSDSNLAGCRPTKFCQNLLLSFGDHHLRRTTCHQDILVLEKPKEHSLAKMTKLTQVNSRIHI